MICRKIRQTEFWCLSGYYGAVCESLKKSSLHIRFDTPGSGRSPVPPTPQTLETLSNDVISLLDLLTLETVLLVGYSLGGLLACNVAATHPSRVKKLILIGPVHPTPNTQKIFEDRINILKEGTYLPIQKKLTMTKVVLMQLRKQYQYRRRVQTQHLLPVRL